MRDGHASPNFGTGFLSRRELLRIGGLGIIGLNLADLFRAEAARASHAQDSTIASPVKSCILLYQQGGPSHLDTWDMKPDAPLEVRGEFKTIATRVPGLRICEHLPRTALVTDKLAIVRSMQHGMRDHNAAAVEMLCGRTPLEGDLIFADHANSFPCYGSVLSYLKREESIVLPHVALPHVVRRAVKLPGQEPGFLGSAYSPLQISRNPNAPGFRVAELSLHGDVTLQRLNDRESLRRMLNEQAVTAEKLAVAAPLDGFVERALTLLTSDAVRGSFDLTQENPRTRDRYGRNKHGQSVLLARRLVESGVRFVTVNSMGDQELGGRDDWDTHSNNFSDTKNVLLPPVDQALSALIEDLEARGLLDSTLVLWMGEFGRTPHVNAKADGGRDHWPHCFSVVLAGGGVKGGSTYGTSDKWAAYPDSDPVSPGDLAATLFWRFGLDPHTEIHDLTGRPYRVADGEPIRELFL